MPLARPIRPASSSLQRFWFCLSLRLVVALIVLLPTTALAAVHNGTIIGDEAQAATCAVGSTTQIRGTVTYDDVSGLFSWNYTYGENAPAFDDGELFGTGTPTVAHFHGPAAPGVSAGVRVTSSAVTPASSSLVISSAFGTELLNELWYLNIHSTNCTGGEVRGQVLFPAAAVPSVSVPMAAVLIALLCGVAVFGVRRGVAARV